jgi:hypothetical protein
MTESVELIARVRARCHRITQAGLVTDETVDALMLCAMLEERTAQALTAENTLREFIKERE